MTIKKLVSFKYLFLLLSVVIVFVAIKPLLSPGFFSMHDNVQIERLFDLDQAIRAGQIPVRIIPNLGFGYGYALFNFYPPFVYYFAEIFKIIGFTYIVSVKLMIFFGFFLSFIFMYLFSKEYFGKIGAVVSAVLYLYAPYHAVDVYVRGALPEFWTFVFVPAIFWSITKLCSTGKIKYLILLSMFGAFIILTHDLVAMMSAPFIVVYFLFLLFQSKNKKTFFLQSFASGVIAALLSAFFWIPAFLEKGYTMVNLLTIEKASYLIHFVYPRQFISSFWGYSGSVPGPFDGMSFSLGQFPVVLFLATIPVAIFLLFRKYREFKILTVFYILFLLSLFIQTRYSTFIWDSIQPLSYIQFPWRFLLFSSFFLSFIVGSIFLIKFPEKIKLILAAVIICVVIFISRDTFHPEKLFINRTDYFYTNTEHIRWDASMLFAEYSPYGIKTKKSQFDTTVVDINENTIARSAYSIVSGEMKVKVLKDLPQRKELDVITDKGGLLRLNTFYFPGWKVLVDGKNVGYQANNDLRLITVKVPPGHHLLVEVFTNTVIRTISNVLSLVGIFIIAVLGLLVLSGKKLQLNKK